MSFGSASPIGEALYNTPGTFTLIVPAGVTKMSMVCVGAGGRSTSTSQPGCGGALAYVNDVPVTPGQSLDIFVGNVDSGATFGQNSFVRPTGGGSNYFCRAGGGRNSIISSTSGNLPSDESIRVGQGGMGGIARAIDGGGSNTLRIKPGAGGAGGYTGNGGDGGYLLSPSPYTHAPPTNGDGGGGAGGWAWLLTNSSSGYGGGGGGTGLYGIGANGLIQPQGNGWGGGGGSGGQNGKNGTSTSGGAGGWPGGGCAANSPSTNTGHGGVRIIWGNGRSFPFSAA